MESLDQNRKGANHGAFPSSDEELALINQGYGLVAGIDEVGRGCLAGPVVAAAVVMPLDVHSSKGDLERVRDSKALSADAREQLYEEIMLRAVSAGVGAVSAADIDRIGIVKATRLAMHSAIASLVPRPQYLLIDFMTLPSIDIPQRGIVKGDALCFSIAAASIIAKVTRDRLMRREHDSYPEYGFYRNKGYGTPQHLDALFRLGPCVLHRRSFAPVFQSTLPGIPGNAE